MIREDLPRHIEGKNKWIVEWWINGKASYGVGFSAEEAMSLIDIMKRYSDKPPVLHLPSEPKEQAIRDWNRRLAKDGAENKTEAGVLIGEVDIQSGKGNTDGGDRGQNCRA